MIMTKVATLPDHQAYALRDLLYEILPDSKGSFVALSRHCDGEDPQIEVCVRNDELHTAIAKVAVKAFTTALKFGCPIRMPTGMSLEDKATQYVESQGDVGATREVFFREDLRAAFLAGAGEPPNEARESITTTITCLRSDPSKPPCTCCKGRPHAFCRFLAFPDFPGKKEHLDDFRSWLDTFLDLEALEGRRAKITVELLPEPCQHPSHENPGLIIPCPECGEGE